MYDFLALNYFYCNEKKIQKMFSFKNEIFLIFLHRIHFLKEIIIVYNGHNHPVLLSYLLNSYVVIRHCFNLS